MTQKLRLLTGRRTHLPSALRKLSCAHSTYQETKEKAPSWWDSHHQSLANALVVEEGKPHNQHTDSIKAWIHHEQHQWALGLAAHINFQKTDKYLVLRPIARNAEGIDVLLETQDKIIAAMATFNLARQ